MAIRPKLGAALYDAIMKGPEGAGLDRWRRQLLHQARGTVLEIGAGTGANLEHYPPQVDRLIALEPNPAMARRMDPDNFASPDTFEIVEGCASKLPVDDGTVDTVVSTLVLCSVPDPAKALAEVRRVLGDDGLFLFLEHVASPDDQTRKWQDRLDPLWNWCTGDCHMNRRTEDEIRRAGFVFQWIERESMPKTPSLLRPAIRGAAAPSSGPKKSPTTQPD